jgi:hypothetical protein
VSVTELPAQDALIKAVAGIEQHRGCASGYRHTCHKAVTSLSRRHFERLLLLSNLLDFGAVHESVHGPETEVQQHVRFGPIVKNGHESDIAE